MIICLWAEAHGSHLCHYTIKLLWTPKWCMWKGCCMNIETLAADVVLLLRLSFSKGLLTFLDQRTGANRWWSIKITRRLFCSSMFLSSKPIGLNFNNTSAPPRTLTGTRGIVWRLKTVGRGYFWSGMRGNGWGFCLRSPSHWQHAVVCFGLWSASNSLRPNAFSSELLVPCNAHTELGRELSLPARLLQGTECRPPRSVISKFNFRCDLTQPIICMFPVKDW